MLQSKSSDSKRNVLDFIKNTECLRNQLVEKINSNTFRGGVRNKQSLYFGVVDILAVAGLLSVVIMTVVEGAGVVNRHSLASFSTLQVKLQYAVKHQPPPSVLLYIKVPKLKKKAKKAIPWFSWDATFVHLNHVKKILFFLLFCQNHCHREMIDLI